jgi:hypothetical protein
MTKNLNFFILYNSGHSSPDCPDSSSFLYSFDFLLDFLSSLSLVLTPSLPFQSETIRKGARSVSYNFEFIVNYTKYRFCQEQPPNFKLVKDTYHPLLASIKEKVKTGQFVPVGGSWVEMVSSKEEGGRQGKEELKFDTPSHSLLSQGWHSYWK